MPPLHYGSTLMCRGGLVGIGRYWLMLAMRLAMVGLRSGFFDISKGANVAQRKCQVSTRLSTLAQLFPDSTLALEQWFLTFSHSETGKNKGIMCGSANSQDI